MFDPKERLTKSVSIQELEGRWALARGIIPEQGLSLSNCGLATITIQHVDLL